MDFKMNSHSHSHNHRHPHYVHQTPSQSNSAQNHRIWFPLLQNSTSFSRKHQIEHSVPLNQSTPAAYQPPADPIVNNTPPQHPSDIKSLFLHCCFIADYTACVSLCKSCDAAQAGWADEEGRDCLMLVCLGYHHHHQHQHRNAGKIHAKLFKFLFKQIAQFSLDSIFTRQDLAGNGLLHWLMIVGWEWALEWVLKQQLQPNDKNWLLAGQKNLQLMTCLHLASCLPSAACLRLALSDLSHTPLVVGLILDGDQMTPLMYACLNGSLECVEELLQCRWAGSDSDRSRQLQQLVQATDLDGMNCLHWCCLGSSGDLFHSDHKEFLLSIGCWSSSFIYRDYRHRHNYSNPNHHLQCCQLLVGRFSWLCSVKSNFGWLPIHLALIANSTSSNNQQLPLVHCLLAAGSPDDNKWLKVCFPPNEKSILHWCCIFGRLAELKLILEALCCGLSSTDLSELICSRDEFGASCLHYACRFDRRDCVYLLLRWFKFVDGRQGFNISNDDDFLLASKFSLDLLNAEDNLGRNSLIWAVVGSGSGLYSQDKEAKNLQHLLMVELRRYSNHEVAAYDFDEINNHLPNIPTSSNVLEVVVGQLLLGLDSLIAESPWDKQHHLKLEFINHKDKTTGQFTALHYACLYGHDTICRFLLSAVASASKSHHNPNANDGKFTGDKSSGNKPAGITPLMLACLGARVECCRVLLLDHWQQSSTLDSLESREPILYAQDSLGRTCLHWLVIGAASNGYARASFGAAAQRKSNSLRNLPLRSSRPSQLGGYSAISSKASLPPDLQASSTSVSPVNNINTPKVEHIKSPPQEDFPSWSSANNVDTNKKAGAGGLMSDIDQDEEVGESDSLLAVAEHEQKRRQLQLMECFSLLLTSNRQFISQQKKQNSIRENARSFVDARKMVSALPTETSKGEFTCSTNSAKHPSHPIVGVHDILNIADCNQSLPIHEVCFYGLTDMLMFMLTATGAPLNESSVASFSSSSASIDSNNGNGFGNDTTENHRRKSNFSPGSSIMQNDGNRDDRQAEASSVRQVSPQSLLQVNHTPSPRSWLVDRQDKNGVTPLHWAAVNGHLDCCRLLVASGASVNMVSFAQDAAQQRSCSDDIETSRRTCAIDSILDSDTPLDYALLGAGGQQIVQFLRSQGAKTFRELVKESCVVIERWWSRHLPQHHP